MLGNLQKSASKSPASFTTTTFVYSVVSNVNPLPPSEWVCVCVCVCVCACVRTCVRACVCVCERERDRQTDRQTDCVDGKSPEVKCHSVSTFRPCAPLDIRKCQITERLDDAYSFGCLNSTGSNKYHPLGTVKLSKRANMFLIQIRLSFLRHT